jgi:hypothetical protein
MINWEMIAVALVILIGFEVQSQLVDRTIKDDVIEKVTVTTICLDQEYPSLGRKRDRHGTINR